MSKPVETTILTPAEERAFRVWAKENKIVGVDHPDSHYDMRGYWKDIASKGGSEMKINAQDHKLHFPDTYKQHGHPTFSQESRYSRGPADGGMWVGDPAETLLEQPSMAVSHPQSPFLPLALQQILMTRGGQ